MGSVKEQLNKKKLCKSVLSLNMSFCPSESIKLAGKSTSVENISAIDHNKEAHKCNEFLTENKALFSSSLNTLKAQSFEKLLNIDESIDETFFSNDKTTIGETVDEEEKEIYRNLALDFEMKKYMYKFAFESNDEQSVKSAKPSLNESMTESELNNSSYIFDDLWSSTRFNQSTSLLEDDAVRLQTNEQPRSEPGNVQEQKSVRLSLELLTKAKISDKPIRHLIKQNETQENIVLSFCGSYGDEEIVLKWTLNLPDVRI
jgi:hypothetical protein